MALVRYIAGVVHGWLKRWLGILCLLGQYGFWITISWANMSAPFAEFAGGLLQ